MDWLTGVLFSKVGATLAGLLGILALWWRGSYHKRQAERAEARAQVAERLYTTKEEERKRHEQVDQANPDQLVDYWRKPAN